MLTKATLTDDDAGFVEFQFNPETIEFTFQADLKNESQTDDTQYIGAKPIKLTLEMLLDEPTSTQSVASRLDTITRWTTPKDEKNTPYEVTFKWGSMKIGSATGVTCHCESVKVKYELFSTDGLPVRARATISLQEVGRKKTKKKPNPTSGGEMPARSRVLRAGDDLAVLAFHEYGSTAKWRGIADRNAIDNPFTLPLGREVVFPARLGAPQ
ncbi:MAG: hypothetical protein AAGA42_05905 [Actinomycetota bacterium]